MVTIYTVNCHRGETPLLAHYRGMPERGERDVLGEARQVVPPMTTMCSVP